MRLILVHGINNEDNTREQIESDWLSAIREGWKEAELPEKPLPKVVTAYYAKDLAELTSKRTKAVGMGAGATSGDDVALEFLKTYQRAAGISDEEIKAAARDADPRERRRHGTPARSLGDCPGNGTGTHSADARQIHRTFVLETSGRLSGQQSRHA